MRRRGFQEVALSINAPGTVLIDDSKQSSASSPTGAAAFTFTRRPSFDTQSDPGKPSPREGEAQAERKQESALRRHTKALLARLRQEPQAEAQGSARRGRPGQQVQVRERSAAAGLSRGDPRRQLSRSSTASTLRHLETDSADFESSPLEASCRRTFRAGASARTGKTKSIPPSSAVHKPVHSTARPHATFMEELSLDQRISGWATALRAALDQDTCGRQHDALDAYNRLNRLITKEAIWEYEQLTSDQKKLLSQVLTCLDQRTQQLRASVKGPRGSTVLPAPTSNNLASVSSEAATVRELSKCLDLLETIRKMGSKTRVPVVLVYRERRHRTQHRHQEKGQSNKVVFAKEKRDFLSLLGLPGSMISEKGIDFSVRPNTASALRRQSEEKKTNSSASTASASATAANTTDTIEVRELEPDEKNGGGTIQTDGGMEREVENEEEEDEEEDEEVNVDEEDDDDDDEEASPKTAKKVLLQLLPFSKRKGSVSPHPKSELSEEEDDIPADARSTLSCDTCSSADSSETEEEVDVATDLAVLGATYAHKESVKPPPFRDSGSTYVSLDLEKIGIKNTRGVVCPFARVSVRDAQGGMVGAGSTQETSEWEVINKNYLRAPSQVHLQRPLEEMSEDVAIFIELRHYKPQKGVISTLCYTFLEKGDLKTGDFICELYSPPVDFSRRSLKTYTEKAFFLHLRVRLLKAEQDDLDLDSPRSNLS